MLKDLLRKLRSEDKLTIQQGLEALSRRLSSLQESDFEEALQALIGVFYIDPIDHPELLPVIEQAEGIVVDLRDRAVPVILRSLGESDFKIHFRLASCLGKMGHSVVRPLLSAYSEAHDDYARVFALYALGKVVDPRLLEAAPLLFQALNDSNPEIRDTAARALGKVCQNVNPDLLDGATRKEAFEKLLAAASDRFAGVRSKALRSLGKMAKAGLLTEEQRHRLQGLLARVTGRDEASNWDVAYIVRAEAEKALDYL